MERLTIAPTRDRLLRDGEPFFYLADTCWSAFTNPTIDEWQYYLGYRRNQGFNALQINIMPQGDRSVNTWDNPLPFRRTEEQGWDFNAPNDAYFGRAALMLAMAREQGFLPALVLLWKDLAPDEGFQRTYKNHPMKRDEIDPYVRLVGERFARFAPFWIVSGDTSFPPESREWFHAARDLLKELTPDLLCTFHLAPEAPLPEEWTDIYLTYSGHNIEHMDGAYTQAQDRWSRRLRRPTINAEPCYEAHGSGPGYRFSAFDVRRALWWSVLSGAKAGFSYGAHGVWSWHRTGQRFYNEAWAQTPPDWRQGLALPGAWDAGFARKIFELYRLQDLDPRQDLLDGAPDQVRMSANADASRFAFYVPYPRDVRVKLDLGGYELTTVNLAERRFERPPAQRDGDASVVGMTQDNADVLIIGERCPEHGHLKTGKR